jgi:protein gp37
MGEQTAIAWTDHTFNPWWGCTRVSPGCEHCYAETFAKRVGQDVWGKNADRRFFGDKHWAEPIKWNAKAAQSGRRERVFCASMADVFEDRPELAEHRARLFDLIMFETPWLDWQLLTKRPQNVLDMVPPRWLDAHAYYGTNGWPANCWIGTTVEDQERADERIPWLLSIPAAVRFLSCELPADRRGLVAVDFLKLTRPQLDVRALDTHRLNPLAVAPPEPQLEGDGVAAPSRFPIAAQEASRHNVVGPSARQVRGCSQVTGHNSDFLSIAAESRCQLPTSVDPEGSGREQSCLEGYTPARAKTPAHNRLMGAVCTERLRRVQFPCYGRRAPLFRSAVSDGKKFPRPCTYWPESARSAT